MIYSKKLGAFVPVQIQKQDYLLPAFGSFTRYIVKDGKIPFGQVDLCDTDYGVHVEYIENKYPELYRGFGKVADQLEVEHCLQRGMDTFEIRSEAALNSHALHYLRGKRFIPDEINEKVRHIIASTPVGEMFNTTFLKKVKMYMPADLIKKYIELSKRNPLLG